VFSRVLNFLERKAVVALTAVLKRSHGKNSVITAKFRRLFA